MFIFPALYREGSRFYCGLSYLKLINCFHSVAYTWGLNLKHHHSLLASHYIPPFIRSFTHDCTQFIDTVACTPSSINWFISVLPVTISQFIPLHHLHWRVYAQESITTPYWLFSLWRAYRPNIWRARQGFPCKFVSIPLWYHVIL